MQTIKGVFSFPHPVNEHSARFVAAGVAIMCASILVTSQMWILIPLTYGFWARALSGPTLSPLGQFATRVVVPLVGKKPKLVPGPPKRFAQSMGAALSTVALVLWLTDNTNASKIVVAMILIASTLESVFALCIGCKIFAGLMKLGVIPDSVCEACAVPQPGSQR